jgi:hypothetical protein
MWGRGSVNQRDDVATSEHDSHGSGIDRRTLIKAAAAAGAGAWVAPVIIDSLASPAAAATCGCFVAQFNATSSGQTGYPDCGNVTAAVDAVNCPVSTTQCAGTTILPAGTSKFTYGISTPGTATGADCSTQTTNLLAEFKLSGPAGCPSGKYVSGVARMSDGTCRTGTVSANQLTLSFTRIDGNDPTFVYFKLVFTCGC